MTQSLPTSALQALTAASKSSTARAAPLASAPPFKALLQEQVGVGKPTTAPAPAAPARPTQRASAAPAPAPQAAKQAASKGTEPPREKAPQASAEAPTPAPQASTAARMARAAQGHAAQASRSTSTDEATGEPADASKLASASGSALLAEEAADTITAPDPATTSTGAPVDPGQALLQAWLGWTPPRPEATGTAAERARVEDGQDLLSATDVVDTRGQLATEDLLANPSKAEDPARRLAGLDGSATGFSFVPTADGLLPGQASDPASARSSEGEGVEALDGTGHTNLPITAGASAPGPAAGAPVGTGVEISLGRGPQDADFAQTFALQVQNLARDGVQEATLHLHPVDLGSIAVQITLDGPQAQVDFAATQASTRELLQAHLGDLAAALQSAGLDFRGGAVRDGSSSAGGDADARPGQGGTGSGRSSEGREGTASVSLQGVARPRGRLDLYA